MLLGRVATVAGCFLGLVSSSDAQRLVGPFDSPRFRTPSSVEFPFVDLDGNASLDLVYGGGLSLPGYSSPRDAALVVFPGVGDGRFGAPDVWRLPAHLRGVRVGAHTPMVLDLNGDGNLDVVIPTGRDLLGGSSCPCEMISYLGDGRGGFAVERAPFITETTSGGVATYAAADIDLDGDEDLVFSAASASASYSVVLVNDGSGRMVRDDSRLPFNAPAFYALRFADFDGDGFEDLLGVAGPQSVSDVVWMNDGTGHFGGGFVLPVSTRWTGEPLDVDQDGFEDIVFGITRDAARSRHMEIWINDRSGGFRDESHRIQHTWPATAARGDRLQVGDFEGDGDLDLYIAVEAPVFTLLINDGSGYFTDGSGAVPRVPALRADQRMVDIDRDGDSDVLVWSGPNPRTGKWFANTTRQILAPDPPVGSPLQVEIHAPVGHLVTYAISLIHRDAYLPGLGWFALDPATAIAWPSVAQVPASRIVTSTIPLPNDPSLAGTELYLQAVDVDSSNVARLSNFWTATIR